MRSPSTRAASVLAALLFCLCVSTPVWSAAQLAVYPLSLSLPANRLSTSLTLSNQGQKPVTVQTELLSWSQSDGEDRYQPVVALVASPPIVRIAPGTSQVIRIGRAAKTAAPEIEQSYRIKLMEVPPDAGAAGAVSTVLHISLPLFVPPQTDQQPKPRAALTAHSEATEQGLRVTLRNAAGVHGRVVASRVVQAARVIEASQNVYALAQSDRSFVLPWGSLSGMLPGEAVLTLVQERNGPTLVLPVVIPADRPPTGR